MLFPKSCSLKQRFSTLESHKTPNTSSGSQTRNTLTRKILHVRSIRIRCSPHSNKQAFGDIVLRHRWWLRQWRTSGHSRNSFVDITNGLQPTPTSHRIRKTELPTSSSYTALYCQYNVRAFSDTQLHFFKQSDTDFTQQKVSPCYKQQTQHPVITVSIIQLWWVPQTLQHWRNLWNANCNGYERKSAIEYSNVYFNIITPSMPRFS